MRRIVFFISLFFVSCVMIDQSKPFVLQHELNAVKGFFLYKLDLLVEKTPTLNEKKFLPGLLKNVTRRKKDMIETMKGICSIPFSSYECCLKKPEYLKICKLSPGYVIWKGRHLLNTAGDMDHSIPAFSGKVVPLSGTVNTGYLRIEFRVLQSKRLAQNLRHTDLKVWYKLDRDHLRKLQHMKIRFGKRYLHVQATGHRKAKSNYTSGVIVSISCMDVEMLVRVFSASGKQIQSYFNSFDNVPLFIDRAVNRYNFSMLTDKLIAGYFKSINRSKMKSDVPDKGSDTDIGNTSGDEKSEEEGKDR